MRTDQGVSKQYHRVLGSRPCECGCNRTVVVTSRRKHQRFFSHQCVQDLRSRTMEAQRVRDVRTFRRSRFGAWIAARAKDGKLTETALLEVMAEAYKAGYHAGYRRIWQRQEKSRAGGCSVPPSQRGMSEG